MSATAVSSPSAEKAEAIMSVLRTAKQPMTAAQIQKEYKGPKLKKGELDDIVRTQLLLDGGVFECVPSGKTARYWVRDERQLIRDEVEQVLAGGPLADGAIATAVVKALGKVTTPKGVKEVLAELAQGKQLHKHPAPAKKVIYGLEPYDALSSMKLKAGTLNDLKKLFDGVAREGVTLERVLQAVGRLVAPGAAPAGGAASQGTTSNARSPVQPGPAPQEANGHTQRRAVDDREVRDQILKVMREIEPNVDDGAPVSIRELRRRMLSEFQSKGVFDRVILQMAEEEQLVIHRHDHPSSLTEEARNELVRDPQGHFYSSVAQRV
jgi:hypothetical protein